MLKQRIQVYLIQANTKWPEYLEDTRAIANYIAYHATDYVDEEFIEEHFNGCHAVLKTLPIGSIKPGHEYDNLRNKRKEKSYAKLNIESMPPIVVMDGEIIDGNHRYRVALSKGCTHIKAYVATED